MDMQQAGSDADSEGGAEALPLHALAAVRDALAATLAASSSGCKDWARDHAGAAGVEQLADVQVQAQLSGKRAGRGGKQACAPATADGAGASASSAARQWWDQRHALDDMLAERVNELAAVVAPALQQCLLDAGSAQARCGGAQDATGAGAVLLLLGNDLHALPWEALPALQGRPVYRLLHDQHAPLAPQHVPRLLGQDAAPLSARSAATASNAALSGVGALEAVDVAQAVYVVDPKGDLAQTRARFEPWFAALPGWQGSAGAPALPSPQLLAELARKELFVFLGHGAGVPCVCNPRTTSMRSSTAYAGNANRIYSCDLCRKSLQPVSGVIARFSHLRALRHIVCKLAVVPQRISVSSSDKHHKFTPQGLACCLRKRCDAVCPPRCSWAARPRA